MSLAGKTVRGTNGVYRQVLTGNVPEAMSEKKKLEILKLTREGDTDAKEILILSHLRLAISIVNRYTRSFDCNYLADELDNAAIVGLVTAVDNVARGRVKHDNVTGYIVTVVHRYISDCLRKSSLIPVPRGHVYRKGTSIREDSANCNPGVLLEIRDLINHTVTNEREQRIVDLKIAGHTDKEVAEIMEIPPSTIFRIRQTLKHRFERLNRNE